MFRTFDIFTRDAAGSLIWVEAAKDLPSAQLRLRELAQSSPRDYLIFNQKTEAFVRSDDIAGDIPPADTRLSRKDVAENVRDGLATAKVLLADDNEHIRRLIRSVLSSCKDIQVCGDAVDGTEAVAKAAKLKPDVVILDLSMPQGGLAAAKEIVAILPQTRILLLSAYDGDGLTKEAREIGVRGFVRKDEAHATLLKAVEALLSGQTFFPRVSLGQP
jgi:CheY-like chemotaxis protein